MNELFGLTSSFRMLSILPMFGEDSKKRGLALAWSPVVGAVIALLCILFPLFLENRAAGVNMTSRIFSALLGGIAYVTFEAFLTRGYHLDGLADSFDGWGGAWDKEKTLEIMRDSHIGSFGTIALVLTLGIKVVAAAALCSYGFFSWLLLIPVFSRCLMAFQAANKQYAGGNAEASKNSEKVAEVSKESEKSGSLAGQVVNETEVFHFVVSLVLTVGLAAVTIFLGNHIGTNGAYTLATSIVFGAGFVMTLLTGYCSRARLGGVTGDILGATVELSEMAMLFAAASFLVITIV